LATAMASVVSRVLYKRRAHLRFAATLAVPDFSPGPRLLSRDWRRGFC
jgi:hypothetical protein